MSEKTSCKLSNKRIHKYQRSRNPLFGNVLFLRLSPRLIGVLFFVADTYVTTTNTTLEGPARNFSINLKDIRPYESEFLLLML